MKRLPPRTNVPYTLRHRRWSLISFQLDVRASMCIMYLFFVLLSKKFRYKFTLTFYFILNKSVRFRVFFLLLTLCVMCLCVCEYHYWHALFFLFVRQPPNQFSCVNGYFLNISLKWNRKRQKGIHRERERQSSITQILKGEQNFPSFLFQEPFAFSRLLTSLKILLGLIFHFQIFQFSFFSHSPQLQRCRELKCFFFVVCFVCLNLRPFSQSEREEQSEYFVYKHRIDVQAKEKKTKKFFCTYILLLFWISV